MPINTDEIIKKGGGWVNKDPATVRPRVRLNDRERRRCGSAGESLLLSVANVLLPLYE